MHLKRKELDNKRYFGGIKLENTHLSDNVFWYLQTHYNLKKVKYIFVSGDGAAWIKSFKDALKDSLRSYKKIKIIPVLDKFHCSKYLNSIFGHDQVTLSYIRKEIYSMTPERFQTVTDAYFAYCPKRTITEESFNQKVAYIIKNLPEIKNQKHKYYKTPCGMEGQVSHVLANRLTSRPKGFCEPVLENLTQMILLKKNGYEITPEMIDTWSKIYVPYDKPKYIHMTKKYKNEYSNDVHMVGLDSTNTNLRHFLLNMKNANSKFIYS